MHVSWRLPEPQAVQPPNKRNARGNGARGWDRAELSNCPSRPGRRLVDATRVMSSLCTTATPLRLSGLEMFIIAGRLTPLLDQCYGIPSAQDDDPRERQ